MTPSRPLPQWEGDRYELVRWIDGGEKRHVQLTMWRAVPSAVHTTSRAQYINEAAVAYGGWVESVKSQVRELLRREDVDPLPGGIPLGGELWVYLGPAFHHRNLSGGRVGEVRTRPSRERDLKNLLWAVEDALKEALMGDDKWLDDWDVHKRDVNEAMDRFVVEIWEV